MLIFQGVFQVEIPIPTPGFHHQILVTERFQEIHIQARKEYKDSWK